jgi:hypothetical protein
LAEAAIRDYLLTVTEPEPVKPPVVKQKQQKKVASTGTFSVTFGDLLKGRSL